MTDDEILALREKCERLEAENDALDQKVTSLSPHGSCGCSYDRPGDLCMHHSPQLSNALTMVKMLREALKPFCVSKESIGDLEDDVDPWPGSDFSVGNIRSARTALAACKEVDNDQE
jgi:hypothetical protein